MACTSCGRGFTDECKCEPLEEIIEVVSTGVRGRSADDKVGISAGRKRAAIDYPLKANMPCEWRFMANCGGGLFPIMGCINGLQKHRHHGPVKDTTRNEEGNVHRICAVCHNTWHAKNDPHYDRNDPEAKALYETLPHDPRPATIEELGIGNLTA